MRSGEGSDTNGDTIKSMAQAVWTRSVVSCDLGFSLVEMMVVLGLVGFLLLAVVKLSEYYNQYIIYNRAVTTRNELIAEVKEFGASLPTLQASALASDNVALNGCLIQQNCHSTTTADLVLYPRNSVAPESALSGTAASPRFYDINGKACPRSMTPTTVTSQCPLEVFTSFVPQCPASPPSYLTPPSDCSGVYPDMIEIVYTVQQVPGVSLGTGGIGQLSSFSGTIIVQGPNL